MSAVFLRITLQGLTVLKCFMKDPRRELSGADITNESGLKSGSLYPILIRYESAGLLTQRWEDGAPQDLGRPKRRLYKITGAGQNAYNAEMAKLTEGAGAWAF